MMRTKVTAIVVLLVWTVLCGVYVMQKAGYLSAPQDDDYAVAKICSSFAKISQEKTTVLTVPLIAYPISADMEIGEDFHQQYSLTITVARPLLPPLPQTPLRI